MYILTEQTETQKQQAIDQRLINEIAKLKVKSIGGKRRLKELEDALTQIVEIFERESRLSSILKTHQTLKDSLNGIEGTILIQVLDDSYEDILDSLGVYKEHAISVKKSEEIIAGLSHKNSNKKQRNELRALYQIDQKPIELIVQRDGTTGDKLEDFFFLRLALDGDLLYVLAYEATDTNVWRGVHEVRFLSAKKT